MSNKINRIRFISFSPTGTSQTIGEAVTNRITDCLKEFAMGHAIIVEKISLTTNQEVSPISYSPNTLYICSFPVYSGRIPAVAMQRLQSLQLEGSDGSASSKKNLVVPIVVYGNRDYDDALLELSEYLETRQLIAIAGAGFVAEHSYSTDDMPTAAHRPDNSDITIAKTFAQKTAALILKHDECLSVTPLLKGNHPYKTPSTPPNDAPVVDKALCTECGACIDVCPTGAITSPFEVDPTLCIKCCACVKQCPEGARSYATPARAWLFENCQTRCEPDLFYAQV